MMHTINCNRVTPSLWEYNIGLDSDAFPLMMLRPLVVFGVNISNGNELFNLYEIRLNKREAIRRQSYVISLAGEFHSEANSDMYEIALDDAAVKINGTSTVDRPIVFEHSSGSLAIKLCSRYTLTPICFDISDEGSMIYWHGSDGGLETWIRSETLDSSLVEETLKTAEKASLEQVVSEAKVRA
jgi:hypothetical protein